MKTNVDEYNEEMDVEIIQLKPENIEKEQHLYELERNACINSNYVVVAFNEGGYNSTRVNLNQLLKFVKINIPELWKSI